MLSFSTKSTILATALALFAGAGVQIGAGVHAAGLGKRYGTINYPYPGQTVSPGQGFFLEYVARSTG